MTTSAALHALLLVGAALWVMQLRGTVRSADTIEVEEVVSTAAEAGDVAALPPVRLVDVTTAGSDAKSDAGPLGTGQGMPNAPPGIAGTESRSTQIRLATNAQPLGSLWSSDTRTRGGLTDVVGAAIGQNGPATDGDSSGGSGRGGGGHKTSFFGLSTSGRRIVFLVDASASMNHPYVGEGRTRIGQMKIELAKSILGLTEEQQFFIIFFNEHPIPMPANTMENAYPQNQQRYLNWVVSVEAAGLTDPRPALNMAMSLRPDVIYLLTDGTFPRDVQGDLNALRQSVVEVNTIAIGDPRAEKSLKPLATRNGGRFTFVP